MEEDETRFEDRLGTDRDRKHIAFVTLSATPFRNSMGENSDRQGILNMQHFPFQFLAVLFLVVFCFKDKLVFSNK